MKKTLIALALSLLTSNPVFSNSDIDKTISSISNEEFQNRILSLTITPFADKVHFPNHSVEVRESFPSNFIIYRDYVERSCEKKVKNSLNFVDFEGSSFGNFPDEVTKLPHASDRIDQLINEDYRKIRITEEKIKESFDLIKDKYCIDVIFSPVIDFRKGGRQYFNSNRIKIEDDWIDYAIDSLEFWMKEANNRGLSFTIKHYPFTTPVDGNLGHSELIGKYEKPEDQMNGVPKELSVDTIQPDNPKIMNTLMEIKERVHKLMDEHGSGNVVMLTNRLIREYGNVPYILTNEPQNDPFLRDFDGLIVSDDLFQISLNEDRAIQAFKNVDMVIISSPNDFKIFIESVAKHAKKDPEILKMLIDKSDKVKMFRKMKINKSKGS